MQTSKRPRPTGPPAPPLPTTSAGQRLTAKIAQKEEELAKMQQAILQGQQYVERHTRLAINLEGQLLTLREELAEAEALPPKVEATPPNRAARRRLEATTDEFPL